MEITLEKIPVEQIIPLEKNGRVELNENHQEWGYIENSLDEFGLLSPLIWNKRTGRLIKGKQRYNILTSRGERAIECIVVDLPADRELPAALALNKAHGKWNFAELDEILNQIDNLDMNDFGFQSIGATDGYLESLLEEDLISTNQERMQFDVTFTFDVENKDLINGYIKQNGKAPITEMILSFVEGGAPCQIVEVK